jgi:membrane carboxypeptidase/penicillin-binding protein
LNYQSARFIGGDAPYFAALVTDYLKKNFDERSIYQEGMQIYTLWILPCRRQRIRHIGRRERFPADLQAALVAVDPAKGYIKALIGGRILTGRLITGSWQNVNRAPLLSRLCIHWVLI